MYVLTAHPTIRGHREPSSVSSLDDWVFFLHSEEDEGHHNTLIRFPPFVIFQIMYQNLSSNVSNYVIKAIL
jgi:hypothetical protein